MNRALAIQTLAMGDLLMVTPMLSGLKAAHPQARVDVLANRAFGRVLQNSPFVDGFIGFPYKELYQAANEPEPTAAPKTLAGLARFTEALPRGYDLVINPCFNDLAGALSWLARGANVLGADITEGGALVMRGDWPAYMHTYLDEPALNSFHQADLLCLAAGVKPEKPGLVFRPTEAERAQAGELITSLGAGPGEEIIAMQAGGGREHRLWPLESFAHTARALQDRGFRILLTGITPELPEAGQVARALEGRALVAAGRTDIGQLAALLERCRLLISNDTGTHHLASALGTPSLVICLAAAQLRNTGPYLPGSLALEADMDCAPCANPAQCSDRRCHNAIIPADVLAGADYLLGGKFTAPPGSGSRFFQACLDSNNLLDWKSLTPGPRPEMLTALRGAWLQVLSSGSGIQAPPIEPRPPSHPGLAELDALASRGIAALDIFARESQGASDVTRLRAAADELTMLSKGIITLGVAEEIVKPLAIYFVRRLAGLDDPTTRGQVNQQKALYGQMQAAARLSDRGLG